MVSLETFGRAWEDHFEELRKSGVANVHSITLKRSDGRETAGESREDWRVWLAKPDKSRTQFQVGDDSVIAVFIGRQWWSWSPNRGFMTNMERQITAMVSVPLKRSSIRPGT